MRRVLAALILISALPCFGQSAAPLSQSAGPLAEQTLTVSSITGITASRLLGRGSAGGTGAAQEITLGTGLTISGTTLTPDVSGSGAAGRLALWSSASGLTSDAGLTYSGTGATFALVGTQLYAGNTVIRDQGITFDTTGSTQYIRWFGSTGYKTSISQISDGVVGVGTGAAGSVAGTLSAAIVEVPNSTLSTPAYRFTAAPTSGIYHDGAIGFTLSGARKAEISSTNLYSWVPLYLINGSSDVVQMQVRAAATLQLGAADSGTPVAQTLTVQGATGTNVAGQDWTQTGSLGTGTAASGKLVFKVGTPGASGSTQHTANTVLTLQDTGTGGTPAPEVRTVGDVYAKSYVSSGGIYARGGSGIFVGGSDFVNLKSTATNVLKIGEGSGAIIASVLVVPNTGTATPAATDSRTVYTNTGDTDGSTITLPAAAAGLVYTIYVDAAQTVTVTAVGDDTIRIAGNVTAAAGSITSNVTGSSVTLTAISATQWVATSSLGTWTF